MASQLWLVNTTTGAVTVAGTPVSGVTQVLAKVRVRPARTTENGYATTVDVNCDASYWIEDTVAAANILAMVNGGSSAIPSISPQACGVNVPYRKVSMNPLDTLSITDGTHTLNTVTKAANAATPTWTSGEATGDRLAWDDDTALDQTV